MAKVTRGVLKQIVKECLVEILSEGLRGSANISKLTALEESVQPRTRSNKNKVQRSQALDNIYSNTPEPINTQLPGIDPMMASLLQDTADSTFDAQVEADGDPHYAARLTQGDSAAKTMATSDPTDLFEGASNWAALAFAGSNESNK